MKIYGIMSSFVIFSLLNACGNKSSSEKATDESTSPALNAGSLSLDTMPDMSSLVQNNETTLRLDITGTAPKMTEIDEENFDEIMFGGAIAEVLAADTVTEVQQGALQRGESVCRNISESANVFRELGGGTLCYMSQVPSLSSKSITIDKEGLGISQDGYEQIFFSGETTKLVKINVKQDEQNLEGGGNFSAMIKIYGKDDYPQGYKVDFIDCQGTKAVGVETFEVDAQAGIFSANSQHEYDEGDQSGKSIRSISAFLKTNDDGKPTWDLSKDRTINNQYENSSSWGDHIGLQKISISADNLLTQYIYSSGTWGDANNPESSGSHTSKTWAKTAFTGSDAKKIALTEMALRMSNSNVWNDQTFTDEVTGAVEWKTSTYAETDKSDLYKEASEFEFDSDELFKTAPKSVKIDLTSFSCKGTPDVELTFDMTTKEAKEVSATCGDGGEGDKLRNLWELCNSQDLQTARQKYWQQAPQ